jgi:hypothetical protein
MRLSLAMSCMTLVVIQCIFPYFRSTQGSASDMAARQQAAAIATAASTLMLQATTSPTRKGKAVANVAPTDR